MEENKGFLDDTSLSKTPKSPLKTSTVLRPNSNRSENIFAKRLAASEANVSFNPREEPSFQALTEVTNIPNFSFLKQKFKSFSEMSFADDANSSLGILHMDNFSDVADMSLPTSCFIKNEQQGNKEESKLDENSKVESLKDKELPSISVQDVEEGFDGDDRNSSSDLEYDGTNIPELNLDYDALSALQDPTTRTFKNLPSLSKIPKEDEESFFKKFEAIHDSASYTTGKSLQISNVQASNEESRITRDSLFESFNPAYDSIFKTLMPNGSVSDDDKVSKLSQIMNACSFVDGNSSELQAILLNQSSAEQNFLKSLQRLSETSLKFSPDEMSARSTSFRSPSPPNTNNCSEASPLSNEEVDSENKNQSKTVLGDEDSKEVVLSGSVFMNNIKKDSTNVCEQIVENQSFDPALEMFKKNEEQLKEEHKFEFADNSKESVTSAFSLPSENNVTAPSWFLELYNGQLNNPGHISIGTLISARTENLGKLSEDSTRERPFFGTFVSTPVREIPEDSSDFSESADQTLERTKEQEFDNASIESSADFKNTTQENEQSTLKSVSDHESGILRRSVLSQLLSEASTSQPLALADRILEAHFTVAKTKSGATNCRNKFIEHGSSSTINRETDKTLCNELQQLTVSTSKEQDAFLSNLTSISSIDSSSTSKRDDKDSKVCECPNCLFRQQKIFCSSTRPASACSNSCKNATPCHNILQVPYGCMAYSNPQEQCPQNLHPSHGSLQHLGNFLHGGQFHNPCAPNPLSTQMLSIAIPQSVPPGPLTGFSSAAFSMQGTAPHSFPTVLGPNELCVPQKICVGDSQSITLTIQNMHIMQYFYHISYISASINEEPVSIEMAGVHFPFMFPRSMSSTTDIQITLNPKYEGKTVVVLQIVACFNPSEITVAAIGNSSMKTKIQYESVRPSILISSHGKDNLSMGSVIAGSKVLEQISITNKCNAVVPICLSFSNDYKDNRISFRVSEMKLQNLSTAAQLKILSPKTILFRLPVSNNEETASPIQIPIIFEAGSDDCHLNFTLTAAIQTATFSEPLGFLRISATVGRTELVLTDATQNRLLFCSEAGSICNQNVTVKNQCSFPVVYDLMIVGDDSNSFSVSPMTLNLQPLQCSTVTLTFSPTSTLVVKGNLQAAAQPHGKVFSLIELIGSNKSTVLILLNVIRNIYLGVELTLEALSSRHSILGILQIKVCKQIFFKEKPQSSFKIIDENNGYTTNLILGLMSKEQKSISVAFTPSRIAPSSGFLAIKPIIENDRKIFSMPLAGYGGTGKLKVAEIYEKEGVGHCLDISVSRERRTVFSNLTVHNIGMRPVFVKVIVSAGNSNKEQIVINPSEFILLEDDCKTLIISCTIENFSMLNATDFGFITLLYGDEIIRQQLRRSVGENSANSHSLYHGVNFDVPFVGEERVPYDSTYISKINISSLFSSSIKKYLIHLNIVEQDASCSQVTFGALSLLDNTCTSTIGNSTMFRRVTAGPGCTYSPPVKDFTVYTLNRLSMLNSPTLNSNKCSLFAPKVDENVAEKEDSSRFWTVKPELLTIDSASKDNRILLINLSNQDLKFKIESAIDVISVSPVSGIVSAKGQIGLRVCIIPYNHAKLYEDYKGFIKVICDGTEKSVLITVLKDQKKMKDSFNASESNTNLEQLQDLPLEISAADKTVIDSTSIFIKNICEFPKEIILNATAPEKVSETTLVVQNPEKSSVEWNIHPFSMLFTQSLEDSLNASNVLQILPSSGVLQAKEKTNIVVKFMPSNPDCFYRFFELMLNFSNGVRQRCNFKISGSSFCLAENAELNKSSAVACYSKKKSRSDIYVENETCEFPNTSLGKNSTTFVTVKNPSRQDFKLNITKPRLPFIVHQSSVLVKSKKFLKIPVIFKPTKSGVGDFEDILILKSENGHEFLIKLKGVCN
ncbi:Centrosomal protein of 192 kDa like protein [Argiope bruennichi]|uniref:Centrosomal protein of 192 kDa like protein n=1 Tax=Argiope bruennichi TaxID=94029 RepID=A0A8T0EVS7_ARGBR|nr:Centrosomal protein of 192 kDa like protein [Argiope bruennichi]